MYQCIKTHGRASAAKKTIDAWQTSVLFTDTVNSPSAAFHISKTTMLISTKFIYFLPYIIINYFVYSVSKLNEIASAVLEIFVPENCPIFLTFFFLTLNNNYIYVSHVKIIFSCFDFKLGIPIRLT